MLPMYLVVVSGVGSCVAEFVVGYTSRDEDANVCVRK